MTRRELGGPDLVVGTGRVGGLPNIANVQRVADYTGAHFLAEQPLQQVFIQRQRALREDRVTQLLELFRNFVVDAGIVVIGTSQHDDA